MILENLNRVVFAGDSITDMQRAYPIGEGLNDRAGFGYVRMIDNLLAAWYPEICVRVTNAGISGNTSRDLRARYEQDVLALLPDYVSICIGINDVWRQFDSPAMLDHQVGPEAYADNLTDMIRRAKAQCRGVIVCTPYYMEPNRTDPMSSRMDTYAQLCRRITKDEDCVLVDFQELFDSYATYHHSAYLSWDRVHPNQIGATLMARRWLETCGADFSKDWRRQE